MTTDNREINVGNCLCLSGTRCDLPCLGSITDRPATEPINDVRWLSSWPHKLFKVLRWADDSSDPFPTPVEEVATDNVDEADIIASSIAGDDNMHTIMLDIDLPAILVPSGTPGNSHLYIDKPVSWETYCRLLDALANAGIVQPGYAAASKARGYTALRLPWKPKRNNANS